MTVTEARKLAQQAFDVIDPVRYRGNNQGPAYHAAIHNLAKAMDAIYGPLPYIPHALIQPGDERE